MTDEDSPNLGSSARRVKSSLDALGISAAVVELPDAARSAAEAARALGCDIAQIAKSLVFRGARSGGPILVIASGGNLVDLDKVARVLGEPMEKADADFVRSRTGYAIGGVPPVGHRERPRTLIDEDLLSHEQIWAAAGTPRAVFALDPQGLETMTGGQLADVKRSR